MGDRQMKKGGDKREREKEKCLGKESLMECGESKNNDVVCSYVYLLYVCVCVLGRLFLFPSRNGRKCCSARLPDSPPSFYEFLLIRERV